MKKLLKSVIVIASAGALGACGTASNDEFANAAPDSSTLALDMTSSDSAASALTTEDLAATDACHPHLFLRTHAMVKLFNHHIAKIFGNVDKLIDNHPKTQTGTTHVWEKTVNGIMWRTTVTKVSAGDFTFTVDAMAGAMNAYINIVTGTSNKTDGTPHTGQGTHTVNFDNLTAVVKANGGSDDATGTIAFNYYVIKATKKVQLKLQNFQADTASVTAAAGTGGDIKRQPTTANYVFTRTSGVGGSIKFVDNSMVLHCPQNSGNALSTVSTVVRWANNGNGTINGRADSMATGGPIPSSDVWLGTTCFDLSKPDGTAENYWQMKMENNGAVDQAQATYNAHDTVDASTLCDAQFGSVPSLTSNAGDFPFPTATVMNDGTAYAYPKMPSDPNL